MSFKFTLIIPVFNQFEVTRRFVSTFLYLAKDPVSLLLIDNGSSKRLSDEQFIQEWRQDHDVNVTRNEINTGVYPTFQQGYEITQAATTPWMFFSHNDVAMYEYGWDQHLVQLLNELESKFNPGIVGFFGARGIGREDIYRAPYDYTQLVRWDTYTNAFMVDQGGKLIANRYRNITVLDGFGLIIRRNLIDQLGGFHHEDYPIHHVYDNVMCLQSHFAGYQNFVLDIHCRHHGGLTSTREKWAEGHNTTDLATHRQAHKIMYEKFRGKLPVSVK